MSLILDGGQERSQFPVQIQTFKTPYFTARKSYSAMFIACNSNICKLLTQTKYKYILK